MTKDLYKLDDKSKLLVGSKPAPSPSPSLAEIYGGGSCSKQHPMTLGSEIPIPSQVLFPESPCPTKENYHQP